MTQRPGNDRDQIDAMMVLTVEASPAARRLAARLVRRRDEAAGVGAAATVELLAMLGVGEDVAS